jgi:DNA-binding response OmpR family regulator
MAKKILIVDDEADFVKFLKVKLEEGGYEVTAAHDGQEGLDKVRQIKPDLIILDIMLPKIDGYKVAGMLRADDQFKNIPIIMLTVKTGVEDIETGMKMGAVSYISKPFKSTVLLGIIQGIIGK